MPTAFQLEKCRYESPARLFQLHARLLPQPDKQDGASASLFIRSAQRVGATARLFCFPGKLLGLSNSVFAVSIKPFCSSNSLVEKSACLFCVQAQRVLKVFYKVVAYKKDGSHRLHG